MGVRLTSKSHGNVVQLILYLPVVPPPKFSWEFELTLRCAVLLLESCEREGMGGGRGGTSSSKSSRSSANSGSSSPSISKKSGCSACSVWRGRGERGRKEEGRGETRGEKERRKGEEHMELRI